MLEAGRFGLALGPEEFATLFMDPERELDVELFRGFASRWIRRVRLDDGGPPLSVQFEIRKLNPADSTGHVIVHNFWRADLEL